jgi:CubicO group peptidase (beta-lactamase class C family)
MLASPKLFTVSFFLCLSETLMVAQTLPTPAVLPAETQQHVEKVQYCLTEPVVIKDDPHTCHTLAERMTELHVPGVSIAVIHNGVIDWAQGFGVQETGGKPVKADTLFQAGSISKPVAAMAALHLVGQGKLSRPACTEQRIFRCGCVRRSA